MRCGRLLFSCWRLVFGWSSGAGASPIIENGLVAHYEFEGNADDSSLVANHGTEYGTVGYSAGLVGQGVEFTGSGYIFLPANSNLSFYANDFSVNIWLNQPNPFGGIVLDQREPCCGEHGFGMGTDGSHASWGGGDGAGGAFGTGIYDDSENDYVTTDDGNWHMLTAVRSGSCDSALPRRDSAFRVIYCTSKHRRSESDLRWQASCRHSAI